MTDIQLFSKISSLPSHLKDELSDFIDFLAKKSTKTIEINSNRISGKAKGLIKIKANFDDEILGFEECIIFK